MRILMLHNYYQRRGGEDESTEQELTLLKNKGHEIYFYKRHNDEIKTYTTPDKMKLFFTPTWSTSAYGEIKDIIKQFNPDIAHFQNFFPLISPAAHYACFDEGVPTVQMLRNYRLLCANSYLYRNGHVCEECLTHSSWRSLKYGCYRDSHLQTLSLVLMQKTHRLLDTWINKVNAFITLTEFARQKLSEGGLPEDKIYVRPNFLAIDPGFGFDPRKHAVFVGRLDVEKGIMTLLEAWKMIRDIPLKLIGDGPLYNEASQFINHHRLEDVTLVGKVPLSEVLTLLQTAKFLVMPSEWYETFGRTIIEAYATGTPVIASKLGAMAELVQEGVTGFTFKPGDAQDLREKVYALNGDDGKLEKMGQAARLRFEKKYQAEDNYKNLLSIYEKIRLSGVR